MNDFYQLVKDSEVNSATLLDKIRTEKATVFFELPKPGIFCKMFHKKVVIYNDQSHVKHYQCCNKCLKVWPHYPKHKK